MHIPSDLLIFVLQSLHAPDLPLKIIAISATVYGLLQLLKQFAPGICGAHALAVNVLMSAVGLLATMPPEQILTVQTFSALAAVVSGAAGIHGTVKKLGGDAAASSTLPALLLFPLLLLTA